MDGDFVAREPDIFRFYFQKCISRVLDGEFKTDFKIIFIALQVLWGRYPDS